MIKNRNYKHYIKLKRRFKGILYKQMPLDLVLGSYFAQYSWLERNNRLKFIIGLFKEAYVVCNSFNKDEKIFSYYIERADYENLIRSYQIHLEDPRLVKWKKISSLRNMLKTVLKLPKAILLILTSDNKLCKPSDVAFCAFAISTIDRIEKIKLPIPKVYTAFNSSFKIESFLSCYFRTKGVNTYSIQHGAYFKYNNEIPIDVINYENVCAENLLCWGDYTKDQIQKLMPSNSNAISFGYPLLDEEKMLWSRNKDDRILVILPRVLYEKQIFSLLSILIEFDSRILIRPHPSFKNKLSSYISDLNLSWDVDNNDILHKTLRDNSFKACIGFNTTAIFECLLYQQRTIQFKSGNDEFFVDGVPLFSDVNELDNLLINEDESIITSSYFFKAIEK
ncbi:hypothetical protein [Citrobacter braakii]